VHSCHADLLAISLDKLYKVYVDDKKAYKFFINQFASCLDKSCGEIVKEGFLRYSNYSERCKVAPTDLTAEDMGGRENILPKSPFNIVAFVKSLTPLNYHLIE